MKTFLKLLLLMALTITLVSCATTGPMYSEMAGTIPQLSDEYGRIYIYRTSVFGAAVQPKIRLNDEVIGKSVARGFLYVDRPPGDYKIVTATEVKRMCSFTLEKGQTRYVRMDVSMGFFVGHVNPKLVDPIKGKAELATCRYTGQ